MSLTKLSLAGDGKIDQLSEQCVHEALSYGLQKAASGSKVILKAVCDPEKSN
jgi:hypothetical protein